MSYQIKKEIYIMNTKLIGSLIGYNMNNVMTRATVIRKLIQDDLIIVKDEKSNKRVVINPSQIKWING